MWSIKRSFILCTPQHIIYEEIRFRGAKKAHDGTIKIQ